MYVCSTQDLKWTRSKAVYMNGIGNYVDFLRLSRGSAYWSAASIPLFPSLDNHLYSSYGVRGNTTSQRRTISVCLEAIVAAATK